MLVLSRKKNESIIIGDTASIGCEIKIVVVEIRGDKVRLGVEAPKEVPVHREEVAAAILRDAQRAVTDHNKASGFTESTRPAAPAQ